MTAVGGKLGGQTNVNGRNPTILLSSNVSHIGPVRLRANQQELACRRNSSYIAIRLLSSRRPRAKRARAGGLSQRLFPQ